MDNYVRASIVFDIGFQHVCGGSRLNRMHGATRRQLCEENAVIADISAAIEIHPIRTGIFHEPLFGLQFALRIVPSKALIESRKLYVSTSRNSSESHTAHEEINLQEIVSI